MGGSDVADITTNLFRSIHIKFPSTPITVIVGKGYRHTQALQQLADEYTEHAQHPQACEQTKPLTEVIISATAEQMRNCMAQSIVAFTTGGQTLYELIRMQTPIIAFQVAENQSASLNALLKFGIISKIYLPEEIEESVQDYCTKELITPPPLIDGNGAYRVIHDIMETPHTG